MESRAKNVEELKSEVDNLTADFHEFQYLNKIGVPFTWRLISRFPSLYIIFRINKIGLKNVILNIKGYKSIQNNKLFDIGYYLKNYQDIRLSGMDPLLHYIFKGDKEGRKPNRTFDSNFYLRTYADVRNAKLNPLVHYSLYGIKEKRKVCELHKNTIKTKEFKNSKRSNESGKNLMDKSRNSRELIENIIPKENDIQGGINTSQNNEPVISFWLAKRGDKDPRTAILKIDSKNSFEFLCNIFREDLKQNNINEGCHAFNFFVPSSYIDGQEHDLQLIDKVTGNLITRKKAVLSNNHSNKVIFHNFPGFLANSLVKPIIYTPFREEDKQCFAMMENIAKYLSGLAHKVESNTLVSVIMVVHNNIDTVKSAVDSILQQDYNNIELIIVDDASDDGSAELLRKINNKCVQLIRNDKIHGMASARNQALAFAQGKFISYLDPCNTWDSRFIATMMGAFLEQPDADAIYGGELLFNENESSPFGVRFSSINKSLIENNNYITLNSLCHKQRLCARLGGFDESLIHYEDWDWILRLFEEAKVYSIPVILTNYYDKPSNINNGLDLDKYQEQVRKKQIDRKNLDQIGSTPPKILKHGVSIIIPNYESLEDIRECLDSILALRFNKCLEIIVVDNDSSESVVKYLDNLAATLKIILIKNDINYGFTYAINQGIKLSNPNNDIIILNNDAIIMHNAIEAMQKSAYELPQCGIVVPQQVLPGGTKTITTHVPYANPQYECDVNLSYHHRNILHLPIFHNGETVELSFAPFFCAYIRRDVLEKSIGLDAEFGRHYRSDRIFCDYITHVMNLKIYYISKAKVYHKLKRSTQILSNSNKKSDFDMIFLKNQWDSELASKIGYKNAIWDI
jgi:GT2 family glycosyltransferase